MLSSMDERRLLTIVSRSDPRVRFSRDAHGAIGAAVFGRRLQSAAVTQLGLWNHFHGRIREVVENSIGETEIDHHLCEVDFISPWIVDELGGNDLLGAPVEDEPGS